MEEYVLCLDSIGKTSIEISRIIANTDMKLINISNIDNMIVKSLELQNKIKLIIWSVYSEDVNVFNDIIKLRKINKLKAIPIIIISNITKNEFVFKAIKSGASDYIIRPYNELFLKNKLLNAINPNNHVDTCNNLEKIDLSIKKIIAVNLKGASRGKYDISMMLLTVVKSTDISPQIRHNTVKTIKKILENKIRETDILIEYNQSSLLIILPYTNEDGAKIFYKKTIDNIKKSSIINREAKGIIISSAYDTFINNYKNNEEDVVIEKLQSKLKVCITIPKFN